MYVIKNWLTSVYSFAVYERDRWVAYQAQSLPPGSKVLDVGAGPCLYRRLFNHCDYKTQDFMQYEGSATGPMADKGQWHYGKVDYVCDASAIPVPSASFDAVLCTEVLEHVAEPIRVVNELARILRKGGALWLTAPLGCGLHQEPHHYYGGYTPYWYRRFLSDVGFDQINVIPNGGFFKHYGQESQRFSAWIDPRRVPGIAKIILAPAWLLTLPWFRLILPLMCHYLDRLDKHRGFCVGYHVTAIKR